MTALCQHGFANSFLLPGIFSKKMPGNKNMIGFKTL